MRGQMLEGFLEHVSSPLGFCAVRAPPRLGSVLSALGWRLGGALARGGRSVAGCRNLGRAALKRSSLSAWPVDLQRLGAGSPLTLQSPVALRMGNGLGRLGADAEQ